MAIPRLISNRASPYLDLIFDTGGAAAYTIGAGAAGNQDTRTQQFGANHLEFFVANNELFNSAIVLGLDATAQTYTFANNSPQTLTLAGNIYGGPAGGMAGNKTLAINGSGNIVISGNLTNGSATTIALTKTGTGTLTIDGTVNATTGLNAQGAYGAVTVNEGVLALNFANFSASGNADMLDSYSPVSLGGGTLQIIGNAAYASTQNFNNGSGVTVNPGFNVVSVAPSGGNLAERCPP